MRRTIYVFAAAMMLFASCSKDEQPVRIDEVKMVSATINAESTEGLTKTTASKEGDVYKIKWVKGDQLSVFNNSNTDMSLFTSNSTGASAKFTGEIPEESEIVAAIYPYNAKASVSDDKKTVYTNVPTEQTGAFNNVVLAGWPKPAEDQTKATGVYDFKYQFEAVCGIVKFSFDPERIKDGKTITSISLTADQPLCGDAKISYPTEGKPVLTPNPNATGSNVYNTITIEKNDGFTKDDYYFATFPINANGDEGLKIVIKFETSTGDVAYKQATLKAVEKDGSKHIFAANIVKNIGNVKVEKYDEITGNFSVNAQWDSKQGKTIYKKVYFSPGNLQYQASTETWRFALNQWDAQDQLGNATAPADLNGNEGARATQSEWIDLFPWGHTGFIHSSSIAMVPYRSSGNEQTYYYASKKTEGSLSNSDGDWGYYCDIVNGNKIDSKRTWRLMTQAEWNYMLNLGNGDPGENAGGRYTQVNKVGGNGSGKNRYMFFTKMGLRTGVYDGGGNEIVRYGILIFPDGFVWPEEIPIPEVTTGWPHNTISWKGCSNAEAPKYTLAEFTIFEKLGCAFLPAAGRRLAAQDKEGNPVITVEQLNVNGVYWSANSIKEAAHFATYDANISLETAIAGAVMARSVRLVKNGEGW